MNVQNFIPKASTWVAQHTLDECLADLHTTRAHVFRGFGALEVSHQGRASIHLPLWSKSGQDVVRNFLMRSIEEILEAAESTERDHRLEELIDSFFYLWSLTILDPSAFREVILLESLREYVETSGWGAKATEAVPWELPRSFTTRLSDFLTTLRNRTWQETIQQPYFAGHGQLELLIATWFHLYAPHFKTVEEFLVLCRAKHQVLIFRLESHY